MLWNYLCLGLLLIAPFSWSTVNGEELTDDQLVDKIARQLSPSLPEASDPKASSNKGNKAPAKPAEASTPPAKKDDPEKVYVAGQPQAVQGGRHPEEKDSSIFNADNNLFFVVVGAAGLAGFVGIIMAGVCYYKLRKSSKAASEVEYPAYGVTGPHNKERLPSPGDRKLAQSAQMYHYQHQKQQMIAMEKANGDMKHDASDDDSEEDNVEGDYTVYECPGLAPTGEMEVKNPLFRATHGDDTPVNPAEPNGEAQNGGLPHGNEEH